MMLRIAGFILIVLGLIAVVPIYLWAIGVHISWVDMDHSFAEVIIALVCISSGVMMISAEKHL